MAKKKETCWACGMNAIYDTEKHHRPFHWHTKPIADGAHMLCQQCCSLLNVDGRMSDILRGHVKQRHGIALDEKGNVVS